MLAQTIASATPASFSFHVCGLEEPLRLDRAIERFVPEISRTQARLLIRVGAALVNGQRVQVLSRRINNGDSVMIYKGREGWKLFYEADPASILYEDDWLIAYCKESGIPTQGIFCDNYNNLYAGLLRMLKKRGVQYLGLHHRLDIDTSGVVLLTKSKQANRSIHYQFKNRSVDKRYLALVAGRPAFDELEFNAAITKRNGTYVCGPDITGKPAQTFFQKLRDFDGYSLLLARPHTGRTHQIRLHLAAIGHPVLGDPLYGNGTGCPCKRTMLHAEKLCFTHPIRRRDIKINAPVPADMLQHIGNFTMDGL